MLEDLLAAGHAVVTLWIVGWFNAHSEIPAFCSWLQERILWWSAFEATWGSLHAEIMCRILTFSYCFINILLVKQLVEMLTYLFSWEINNLRIIQQHWKLLHLYSINELRHNDEETACREICCSARKWYHISCYRIFLFLS